MTVDGRAARRLLLLAAVVLGALGLWALLADDDGPEQTVAAPGDTDRVPLEGFGEVSAKNLIAEIESSKELPFSRVLFALGIPGVGYINAESLAEHFGTMDALLEAQPDEIERAEGIGPILAEQIFEELSEPPTRKLIERLRKAGMRMELDPS